MKTILTPIDFSSVTPRVVEAAAQLAQSVDGLVLLLHVCRVPALATDFWSETSNLEELKIATDRAADGELAELSEKLEQRGVPTRSIRLTGLPARIILARAARLSADYIVIGSHGRTAFYDLVIGSTASAVIKGAPCPVIVVPPMKEEQNSPPPPASDPPAVLACF